MEIARELGVNAAAVTRQVKELEDQRLVTRKADPRDARRSSVWLTAKGMRKFLELHERVHALERSLRAGVGDEEFATAIRVLLRLRAALEELR
jgi:DNA-binding MarR family transcriptional regulator